MKVPNPPGTWDNVYISDEDIAEDNAYVYIDKELTRASKRAIEAIGEKDIYYIFTPLMPNTSTRLILKKPKTDSSIRKIWLPKTVAYILLEWKKAGPPNVVFHSLCHSSTTYKMKLNHGDLKATQGDTGHAEIDMITRVYAHILDEGRKVNAQKFETAFYTKRNPGFRNISPPEPEAEPSIDIATLIDALQKSPELASTLANLIRV